MDKKTEAYEKGLRGDQLFEGFFRGPTKRERSAHRRGLEVYSRREEKERRQERARADRERQHERRRDQRNAEREARLAAEPHRVAPRRGQAEERDEYLAFSPCQALYNHCKTSAWDEKGVVGDISWLDACDDLPQMSKWLMTGTEIPEYLGLRIACGKLSYSEARNVSVVLAMVLLGHFSLDETLLPAFGDYPDRAVALSREVEGLAGYRSFDDRREIAAAMKARARFMS